MAETVVLFDSQCCFCSRAAQFIMRRDPIGEFRFASIHSEIGKRLLTECGIDPDDARSLIVIKNGRCLRKSDAALEIARNMEGCWSSASMLRFIPKRIRDRTYDLIAINRDKLPVRTEKCSIPTPEERLRFLD